MIAKLAKYKFFATLGFAILCVITLFGGISHASVLSSKHDLSVDGGSQFIYRTEQVCVFCHTPHGGKQGIAESTFWNSSGMQNDSGTTSLMLWNRDLSNASDHNGYSTYTSSTMNGESGQVRAYSLLCLSCHDGVGALNVLARYPKQDNSADFWGAGGGLNPDGSLRGEGHTSDQIGDVCYPGGAIPCDGINIGDRQPGGSDTKLVDLRNDHPVSIDYDTSHPDVTSGGLVSPNNTDGYAGSTSVRLFPNPSGTRASLECSTCHNPHDNSNGSFLVMSNSQSALCVNCHNK